MSLLLLFNQQSLWSKSLTDGFTMSDLLVRDYEDNESDSFTIVDNIVNNLNKILSDSVTFSEIMLSKEFTKILSDSFSIIDSIIKQTTLSESDVFILHEQLIFQNTILRYINDYFTMSDSIAQETDKAINDQFLSLDTISKEVNRSFQDSFSWFEMFGSKEINKSLSDSFTLTDSFVKQLQRMLQIIKGFFYHNLSISSSITRASELSLYSTLSKQFILLSSVHAF